MAKLGVEGFEAIADVMRRQMLFLDPPAHTRLRKLCSTAFTPRQIERLEDYMTSVVDELIDPMVAGNRADIIGDFAQPLPSIITAHMLGVPREDHLQLKAWVGRFCRDAGQFPA